LQDINNLLNSGDVPNLFDDNEVNSITAAMRPICQALNLPLTKVALYSYFIRRVRANIHMCLCMSPGSEVFNTRLRNSPSLVNNCCIDFFAEWPEEALKSVAFSALDSVDLHDDTTKAGIVSICGKIHQSVEHASARYLEEQRRYNYVTPTSYLEVLSTFKTLLALKRNEVSTAKRRLVVGLDKLQSTEVEVAQLEKELIAMQPVLIKTSEDVSAMMIVIEKDKAEAAKTREVVVAEEEIAATKAHQCQEIKDSAEKDLAEALPALDAAVAVLRNLKVSDLSEVAKYANPPAGVKLVMEAMCVLREIKPAMVGAAGQKEADYWAPGKKMLQDAKGLLDAMFVFDKDNIPDKVVKSMMPYIENPDFEPDKIAAVSKACTAMCQWARAMIKYHFVAKEVEPKRIALKQSEEELDELTQRLNTLRAELRGVESKIAELEANFNASVAKKEELAAKVADATVKQDRAGRLLGGLGGEKIRWIETVKSLTEQEANLIGDVCIAAGAVAYLGPFTSEYRIACSEGWRSALIELKLAHTEGCTVSMVMADPVVVRQWRVDGLPADTVSTENGIILSNARRWPLCVDPQGQANKWIKNMEAAHAVQTCKPSDKEFLRTLENAVRFGKPVVMENILETLDPSLEPILLRQTFKQGGAVVMKIGDNIVPYHQDFKFYLTSKLPNPHYAPEQSVKLTLLNFTVTMEGLEDQLLGITVAKERPDLDELKNSLVISGAKMATQLKEIESTILRLLSESEGNILDDESLINTLSQSKVTSNEINAKAEEAAKTEVMIDETREQYRPVAFRASLLFFCVADMGNVDPMYQYSMPWFVNLFVKAIEDSAKADDIAQRLVILGDFFTYLLYENICRSLFEAHKLLFSFIVAIKILQGDGKINADEWRFFLSGSSGSKVEAANPDFSWITSAVWGAITSLACLPAFEGLQAKVSNNVGAWRAYFDSSETHEEEIPSRLDSTLDPLQKLCVLRSVRPDKVVPGMQHYVKHYIGQRFIEPPPFNIGVSFKDASNIMPIVFVISPGSDPYDDLLKLAVEMKMNKKLQAISLGQGQGPIAEKAMSSAMERGTWILLQNCHLAASWMPKLEAIVEQYVPSEMHRDYRLWLTSLPSPQFPVSILQNSVKMTIEPPRGIKMNMKGSYNNFTDAYLEAHPKSPQFKKLLYGLCFFHALLQDRRKFGALGFNIRYEFTAGDLKCCILQLETYLAKYDEVPYQVLVNLFGHINYGGRITDDWDRRCVLTTLMSIVHEGIMGDDFMLAPGNECYRSPPTCKVAEYIERIVEFPMNPHPNIFGLHANADITCAQNETQQLCDIMLSLQPKVSTGGGKSREETIGEVACALQARELKLFPLDEITERYPLSYEQSMNTVLSQESMRYNKLIRIYNKSLTALLKALKGLIVMSADLEAMATSLFSNQVPATWSKAAYPSLKPLASWVEDLVQRIGFLQNWNDGGPPPTYWISGFFFPQAFLTGTLQNYARRYKVAIDTVSFAFHVKAQEPADVATGPEDGCFIHGFFLEGATWDAERCLLSEARPKELYSEFPMLWLKPEQDRVAPTEGVYACPAYKTTTRAGTLSTTGHSTNFVLMVELPSDKPCSGLFHKYAETYSAHWIQRAVALFTTLSY
jgi:dynein heavy chain